MTRAHQGPLGPMAPLVSGVPWAQLEALDFLARVAAKALLALQARRGPRENAVPLALLAKMGSQGPWVLWDPLELPGLLARMGTRGRLDLPVTRGAKATREMRAPLDQQGHGVLWDTPAPRGQMELRDAGDPQASLDRKEMMESEALWG